MPIISIAYYNSTIMILVACWYYADIPHHPTAMFSFQVSGIDDRGLPFDRITHTAIKAIRPQVPIVTMPAVTRGHYDQTATLVCTVVSDVPYSLQWSKDGRLLGNKLYYRLISSYNENNLI